MFSLHLEVVRMTLFSLASKNMKGNLNHYLIYFVSLVFSMVVYFTFSSLQYSDKIQESILLSGTMNFMFTASSIVLIVFVAIFIIYSNSFFTRQRKREVGLYSMLGLRKKTIARMLFYENLIMGTLAIIIGIVLGTLLSKLFSMILIKLMGSTAEIDFGLSLEAILQTLIVFMVIILFTSIQGYRLIYRFQIIELFHAEKKGEQMPRVSTMSSFIGIISIAVSYFLILRPFPEELTAQYVQMNYGLALIILILGTHLFFRSVTVYLLKWFQRRKSHYYRGTHLIEVSQLLYRIRGNARTFTLIAILSAVTITFFGATYSGYYGSEKVALQDVPFSYTHLSKGNTFDSKVEKLIRDDTDHPVLEQVSIPMIKANGALSSAIDYETDQIKIIPERTFLQISQALDRGATLALSDNEAAVIKPRLTKFSATDFIDRTIILETPNQTITIVDMVEGAVLPFDHPDFFVVVSDGKFDEISEVITPSTYLAYEVENEKLTEATAMKIDPLIGEDFQVPSSFYIAYKQGKEGNALNLFILGFLGLVFLAATGSII